MALSPARTFCFVFNFMSVGIGAVTADAQSLNQPGQLDRLSQAAKQVMSSAYAQTISTYNIALEVQHMERALNANLSQTLRSSLAFGKSLR
jgi:hypothetical protein